MCHEYLYSNIQCNDIITKNANMNGYGSRTCLLHNAYLFGGQIFAILKQDPPPVNQTAKSPMTNEQVSANLHALSPDPNGWYNSAHITPTLWRPNLIIVNDDDEARRWISMKTNNATIPRVSIPHFPFNRAGVAYSNIQHRLHDFFFPIFQILYFYGIADRSNEVQVVSPNDYLGGMGLEQFRGISVRTQMSLTDYVKPIQLETLIYGLPELASHTMTRNVSVERQETRPFWHFRNFYLKNFKKNMIRERKSPNVTVDPFAMHYELPSFNVNLTVTFLQKRTQRCAYDPVISLIKQDYPGFKTQIIEWENGYTWRRELEVFLETDILVSIDGTIIDSAFFLRPGSIVISLGRNRCQLAEQIMSSIDYIKVIHFNNYTSIETRAFNPRDLYAKIRLGIKDHAKFEIPRSQYLNLHPGSRLVAKIMNYNPIILKHMYYSTNMHEMMCTRTGLAPWSIVEDALAKVNSSMAEVRRIPRCR